MRLRRLDLCRFGKFTDHSIDFGQAKPDTPDLHIIYGLNEAGKSTTFAAYLDLLFGIGERSTYNFLHPYNTMKIGGRLEFDGAEHELARLKLRTGSLIDDRGQPVSEALLAGALGGIGRDAYRTMFSLDDQSLKDGGNAIIQSKGELGELLFSASSGLAGLSRSLLMATEEANTIYKKRSSGTRLAELKRALETLKLERNAIDTLASSYSALKATHDQADAAYQATNHELAEAKTRHQEQMRLLGVLPAMLEVKRLTGEIAAIGDLPRSPAEWFTLLPQLSRDETRLQALLETADRAVRQLEDDFEAITVDDDALAIGGQIDLLDQGRVRYLAAESDLPKRRLALAEQDGLLARLLCDLEQQGHADPEALLLPTAQIGILRDLIERRSGVEAQLTAARRELARVRDALDRLQEDTMGDAGGRLDPVHLSRLDMALTRLGSSDLMARIGVEERALVQSSRSFDSKFAELLPWQGMPEDLQQTVSVEPRQIEAWRTLATAIDKRIADHETRLREATTEQTLTRAKIGAVMASGPIDDSDALQSRAARDDAWQAHLKTLDSVTARLFEDYMRRDDVLAAERLSRAQELAELRQLRLAEATTSAAIERHQALLTEALGEQDRLSAKVAAVLPAPVRPEGGTLDLIIALDAWNTRRQAALSSWNTLQQGADQVESLKADLAVLTGNLSASLEDAGIGEASHLPLSDLMQAAGAALAAHKSEEANRQMRDKALANLVRDVTERERDIAEAEETAVAWDREWSKALSHTWFADKKGLIPAIRAILNALATLPGLLRERQDLSNRIAAMERDQEQFCKDVALLRKACGDTDEGSDPLALAHAMLERHEKARGAVALRASRQTDLEKQRERRQALEEELAVHNARKTELTRHFGADTLAAVEVSLDQARERERLEDRVVALRRQIAEALRVADFEDAALKLADIDTQALEREAVELDGRIEHLTESAKLLYTERSMAWQKLEAVGGDDAVARIEARRRTIFLEIEELALRNLRLRTGTAAAEQALHIYREKHRSSMMNRASEAFRMITGGNYSGLTTQPDKDREILIGVTREGGSKLADAMSTGTQFQLYLALRLAGYEEFATLRPPVPFVADDIMESFDNPRSEEVFRLLGEMAKVGQVIYLTHHWHLCEIARSVVPSVTLHQLP